MTFQEAMSFLSMRSFYVHRYPLVLKEVAEALLIREATSGRIAVDAFAKLRRDPICNYGPTPGTYYAWNVAAYLSGYEPKTRPKP